MSKIKAELVKATELSVKRDEDKQDFLARLMVGIAELSDDAWEELTEPARQWYNAAAEAKNAKKKSLPDFPDADAEEAEPEKAATPRRGAKVEDKEEAKPTKAKVGMTLVAVTKRGKTATGKCVEVDEDTVVLDVDGEDVEFTRDRLESLTEAKVASAPVEDDEPAEPIKVGVEVKLVNKRGKVFTGKIVEMDEDVVVLDIDGADMEFSRDRVESMEAVGGGKPKAEPEKTSTRRGASPAEKDNDGDEGKAPEKAKRVSNEGISIGQRIKELIADDLDATVEDIAKALKKEKIEFKENTLGLNYKDAHKFIEVLRAKKMLK